MTISKKSIITKERGRFKNKRKKKLEREKKLSCGEEVGGKLITKHRHCTMYTRNEIAVHKNNYVSLVFLGG